MLSKEAVEDRNLIDRAYDFAEFHHRGQLRAGGEPYFTHCEAVYRILKDEFGLNDENILAAALLHDIVEDTTIDLTVLNQEFNPQVAELVDGVTKLSTKTNKDTLIKVLSKTYLNPTVAVIKLADRLHNLRTMDDMPVEKQNAKARETLDVYTRLAESLGLWSIKTEIEDLCFKFLYPQEYLKIKDTISTDFRLDPLFTAFFKSRLEQLLVENNYSGRVEIRKNGYWAVKEKQRKLALEGKCNPQDFKQINDLVSFRVLLPEIDYCYRFLGCLHQKLGQNVDFSKFDEYIGANQRINGYQALQTTLNLTQGAVEVALVTPQMEEFNNWGVVSLIRKGETDLKDYALKIIFTPSNSIRFLPKDATGADFAAAIYPQLLAEAEYILIDGQRAPLSTVLPHTSTVEVITGSFRRAPLVGIEEFCLPSTRKIIQEQRIQENRDQLIAAGKEIMQTILAPRGLLDLRDLDEKIVKPVINRFGCQSRDDLYFQLGNKALSNLELNQALDAAGITKEKLGLTTVKLIGRNRPKILMDVAAAISNQGQADIIRTEQKQSQAADLFDLKIVVKNLTKSEEDQLRCSFQSDPRFTTVLVV